MKGASFLLRCLAEIPSRMVQVLHCGMLPSHLRFRTKTQAAWPESWTVLCTEMRSFQCRCFWKMLPDRFCTVTILLTGRLGCGVVAGYESQSRFPLAKPFLFRCGCGFTFGRKSSTTELVGAIATASERVLDFDTIAIHRIFCVGSG